MIHVRDLSKTYGETRALQGVSFDVEQGEVMGFLGPNGAGKTTTMRILAGYFPATSGTATVGGFDVFDDSLEVRRRIGYLPENPPLYREMTVWSFLRFCARLRGVERSRETARLEWVVERCGLEEVAGRIIGNLSKGYRQRVGLAQALVHDPPVLILDEPTVGLDPRQIIEIRELIRELGRDRTVILSTHILPEVQALCQKVVIVHRGRIAVEDSLEALEAGRGPRRLRVLVGRDGSSAEKVVARLDAVAAVHRRGEELDVVEHEDAGDARPELARALVEAEIPVLEIGVRGRTLEEIFVGVTAEDPGRGGPTGTPAESEAAGESGPGGEEE